MEVKAEVKQSLYRSIGAQEVQTPRFLENRHINLVWVSALYTGRLYPQEISLRPVFLNVCETADR